MGSVDVGGWVVLILLEPLLDLLDSMLALFKAQTVSLFHL